MNWRDWTRQLPTVAVETSGFRNVATKSNRTTLDNLDLVGRTVRCRMKGDFSDRPERSELGKIADEIAVIVNDVRFAVHQIAGTDGRISYRYCYHTLESRPRPGCTDIRVGWGQYAPIIPAEALTQLNQLAQAKGWEPWLG